MIKPAPTSKIAPDLARGILAEPPDGTHICVTVPNTSYQLHLVPTSSPSTPVGKRIIGRIHAKVRRVDVVHSGGRYVEPVYGSPRRVQGSVIEVGADTITVSAGVPIICELTDKRQKASDFEPGQFVSFDVLDGATFTPVS